MFAKRKAKPTFLYASQSNEYVYDPQVGQEFARGRASMLKRLSAAIPRPNKKTDKAQAKNATLNVRPRRMTIDSTYDYHLESQGDNMGSFGFSDSSNPHTVMNIGHSGVNLGSITPRSSEETDSFERHITSISSGAALPFGASTHTIAVSETTAVPDALVPFPTSPQQRSFFEDTPASNHPYRRARSLSESTFSHAVHFEPYRKPLYGRPIKSPIKDIALKRSGAISRPTSAIFIDQTYQRGRRTTLDTTNTVCSPTRPSFSSYKRARSRSASKRAQPAQPVQEPSPPGALQMQQGAEDPFSSLFTSCAISLFLLVILAAGKDVLYVIALLPMLMALARHFTDFDKLIAVGPVMKRNLESLITL